MTNYRIIRRSTGEDFGDFQANSDVDALAVFFGEAGYEVGLNETGNELVFASEDDARLCGGFDHWSVRAV